MSVENIINLINFLFNFLNIFYINIFKNTSQNINNNQNPTIIAGKKGIFISLRFDTLLSISVYISHSRHDNMMYINIKLIMLNVFIQILLYTKIQIESNHIVADKYTSHIQNHSHFVLYLILTYSFARKYIHKKIQRNNKQNIIEYKQFLNNQYNKAINVVKIRNGVCNSYFWISYIIKKVSHRLIAIRNHN